LTAETTIVSGLAGRYATALFDLALEQKQADAVMASLEQLASLIEQSPDLTRLIKSPIINRDEQGKAMAALLERVGLKGVAGNFVLLVTKNRRLFLLPEMIRQFRVLLSQHKGEVPAEVTSALPLSAAQVDQVRARLAKVVGREVRLGTRVDPKILGGLVVRVGSRMVDSSLRTKLFNLQNAMKENA